MVASDGLTFTALTKTARLLPFITNWSMRRSSFSGMSLPGCVMMRPSSFASGTSFSPPFRSTSWNV